MTKYSIILPVRNGSNYVRECVSSILSQTVQDFELLVLENASTDNTLEIIHSFNDDRIKIIPASAPLSMEDNWHRVVDIPKKEFITLIGHDDMLDKNYLQVMQDLIAEHPDASLYQTHFRYIDSNGQVTARCKPMEPVQSPETAISNFLCNRTDLMGTGFMMRSSDYDRVGGIPPYPSLLFADMELWIELARIKYFAVSPQECFSYRRHASATTSSSSDVRVLKAFGQLVAYLQKLRNEHPELQAVISRDSISLLRQYCQGLTHKVLRTPKSKRETPSVAALIDVFRQYGEQLSDGKFEPLDYSKIRMGKLIDSNAIFRAGFHLFRKLYGKPVLKTD